MLGDTRMRKVGDDLPVPTFDDPAWVDPKPLSDATVAIVTSAALHRESDDRFAPGETEYRLIPADARDLVLGHWSPNFDRSGFAIDTNVVFPIDRLAELAAAGTIGAVAPATPRSPGTSPTMSPPSASIRGHGPRPS